MPTPNQEQEISKIDLLDGKYTVTHQNGLNLNALRYGQQWRDLNGDGLVLAMAQRINELESYLNIGNDNTEKLAREISNSKVEDERTYQMVIEAVETFLLKKPENVPVDDNAQAALQSLKALRAMRADVAMMQIKSLNVKNMQTVKINDLEKDLTRMQKNHQKMVDKNSDLRKVTSQITKLYLGAIREMSYYIPSQGLALIKATIALDATADSIGFRRSSPSENFKSYIEVIENAIDKKQQFDHLDDVLNKDVKQIPMIEDLSPSDSESIIYPDEQQWNVEICRQSSSFGNVTVKAPSLSAAINKADELAGDKEYSEKESHYTFEAHPVFPENTKRPKF